MISRHYQFRESEGIQEGTGLLELMRTSTLRKISRNNHQVGTTICNESSERRYHLGVNASKMQIRYLN